MELDKLTALVTAIGTVLTALGILLNIIYTRGNRTEANTKVEEIKKDIQAKVSDLKEDIKVNTEETVKNQEVATVASEKATKAETRAAVAAESVNRLGLDITKAHNEIKEMIAEKKLSK